jgi:hypothetical protein
MGKIGNTPTAKKRPKSHDAQIYEKISLRAQKSKLTVDSKSTIRYLKLCSEKVLLALSRLN